MKISNLFPEHALGADKLETPRLYRVRFDTADRSSVDVVNIYSHDAKKEALDAIKAASASMSGVFTVKHGDTAKVTWNSREFWGTVTRNESTYRWHTPCGKWLPEDGWERLEKESAEL